MGKNTIPLSLFPKEKVELVLKSIRDGKLQYDAHIKKENFPTQNGKYHEIWNYIFKNIEKNFNDFPYRCLKISRGKLWEFITIYDQETNILYMLMKQKRIEQIKNDDNNDFHYSKILNYMNNCLQSQKKEQLSMFPQDTDKKEYIERDLERMLGDINGQVKLCVTMLFSEIQGKVINMSGNVFDYNLDIIKTESWDKYIKADIDEIIDTKDELDSENPPIKLGIKELSNNNSSEKENTKDMIASKVKKSKRES